MVTEQGKILATILPAQEHPDVQALKKLVKSGLGYWKGGKPKGASRPIVVKGKPVGDIVLHQRR